MVLAHPFFRTLILHETALDLHAGRLRKAISSIPQGVLTLEEGCRLVISDFTEPDERVASSGILLAYGYHFNDFGCSDQPPHPASGLIFNLNPPYFTSEVTDVRIHMSHEGRAERMFPSLSTFKVKGERFMLTRERVNLDVVACDNLNTLERYRKQ